jgi:hypothetical protein
MTATVLPIREQPGESDTDSDRPPVFDLEAYADEFNDSIVPAYRRGVADEEWPADIGLARSIIPPGTAGERDFSHLAPRLPPSSRSAALGAWRASVPAPTARSWRRSSPRRTSNQP